MPLIGEYAKRFGIYDSLPPYLSFALGAGETTLLRMVGAYAMLDNGGKKVQPTLIDRIQDRYGKTIYRHDQRECRGCAAPKWENQNEPTLVDKRDRVIDPMTAYQITSIMEGVVQRGTATVVTEVGKPIADQQGGIAEGHGVEVSGRKMRILSSSRANLIGLVSYSSQPAASAFSRSPAMAWAVSAMIGMALVSGSALSWRAASQPSSTGRLMSMRISAGASARAMATP
jgi:hypothetical protein